MLNLRNMILAALMGGALLIAGASVSHATQPECTGDRHYDGVACCPDQPEECPTCEECKPEKSCPDPAPCQPVTCKVECKDGDDGKDGTTTVVNVDRCPEAPTYVICNGVKLAVRRDDCWVSIEPGVTVRDIVENGRVGIEVEYRRVTVH